MRKPYYTLELWREGDLKSIEIPIYAGRSIDIHKRDLFGGELTCMCSIWDQRGNPVKGDGGEGREIYNVQLGPAETLTWFEAGIELRIHTA